MPKTILTTFILHFQLSCLTIKMEITMFPDAISYRKYLYEEHYKDCLELKLLNEIVEYCSRVLFFHVFFIYKEYITSEYV